MTISTATNKAQFSGNGVTTAFPFTFKTFVAGDLDVYLTRALGVDATLALTTHYTISLSGDQDASPGGTLTMLTAPSTGETLTILRTIDATQLTDITNGGGFYPQVVENALDKLTMLAQQNAEKLERAIIVGVTETISPTELLASISESEATAAASAAIAAASAASISESEATAAASAAIAAASAASISGFRNLLINSDFRINQRGYVSAVDLASGVYAHDRWKGGASGVNYTFTQLAHSTQITIASGKSIIQVVEDKNVVGGSYILSWEGAAQARYGLNSATPSGSYASSPILITGQTAGTVISVEFNTGTLGKVQLEQGTIATRFENRPYGTELALCQRYFEVLHLFGSGYFSGGSQTILANSNFKQTKRTPTPTIVNITFNTWFTSINVGTLSYSRDDSSCMAYGESVAAGIAQFDVTVSASDEI